MTGKTVLVTGATPGSIGYQTALHLAQWNANIVVTTVGKGDRIQASFAHDLHSSGASIDALTVKQMDLRDASNVREFCDWYRSANEDRLHVLVNNAGIHKNIFKTGLRPADASDGEEIHWRTNFLGTFQLTSLLLPSLLKTAQSEGTVRVINVVSHLHDRVHNDTLFRELDPYNSWDAYAKSKLALVHHSFKLNRRFAESSHLIGIALHPGSVFTNLTRSESDGVDRLDGRSLSISDWMAQLVLLKPADGAQTSLLCATDANIKGGKYYDRCKEAEPARAAKDECISKRLWDETQTWFNNLSE